MYTCIIYIYIAPPFYCSQTQPRFLLPLFLISFYSESVQLDAYLYRNHFLFSFSLAYYFFSIFIIIIIIIIVVIAHVLLLPAATGNPYHADFRLVTLVLISTIIPADALLRSQGVSSLSRALGGTRVHTIVCCIRVYFFSHPINPQDIYLSSPRARDGVMPSTRVSS